MQTDAAGEGRHAGALGEGRGEAGAKREPDARDHTASATVAPASQDASEFKSQEGAQGGADEGVAQPTSQGEEGGASDATVNDDGADPDQVAQQALQVRVRSSAKLIMQKC